MKISFVEKGCVCRCSLFLNYMFLALAGMAQLVGALSCSQKVAGLIPSQGIYLGPVGLVPSSSMYRRQPTDVSFSQRHFSLISFLPFFLPKSNEKTSSGEEEKNYMFLS